MVARGYVIPRGVNQKGGGRAPALRVARCQTTSGVGVRGVGLVLLGPVGARQGPGWSHIGPYISRTLIRDSRVIRRGSSGSIGPCRDSDGFPSEPCFGTTSCDGARQIARLSRIDAQSMYRPPGHTTASQRALRDPTDPRRHRRTPLNMRLTGLGGLQLLSAEAGAIGRCFTVG